MSQNSKTHLSLELQDQIKAAYLMGDDKVIISVGDAHLLKECLDLTLDTARERALMRGAYNVTEYAVPEDTIRDTATELVSKINRR